MIITHFLDNDLYKFTTMNAIQKKFPSALVRYEFFSRDDVQFPDRFADLLKREVENMAFLALEEDGLAFLKERCPYFDPVFIDLLKGYKFNPDEVTITQDGGRLNVVIEGLWYRTVLWEVPLLALISELYFIASGLDADDFEDRVNEKARGFAQLKAEISDFGTRRRYSLDVQDRVVEMLSKFEGLKFNGTSNVYLAMKYGLKPIGTHPHEWFMYHAAHYGYRMGTDVALENWVDVYEGDLGIALSDTFTSKDFFRCFNLKYSKLFDGVRWDSGDPLEFTDRVVEHYKKCRIDPAIKTVVYSDALDLDREREIKHHVAGRVHDVYGVGTYLTNDVGVKPLNIVIKLTGVKPFGSKDFIPAIKLSDAIGKHSGDENEIELCKKMLKLD